VYTTTLQTCRWKIFTSPPRPDRFGAHPASYPMGTGAFSLRIKRPGHEADYSPPSSARSKNTWSYTSLPQYAFIAWWSIKAQGRLDLLPLPVQLPWSRVLLEKLTMIQLVKKFISLYGTWRFITVFTRALHRSINLARCIQFTPYYSISLKSILILCPDRLCGPPSLLSNEYQGLLPGGKAAEAWSWPLISV